MKNKEFFSIAGFIIGIVMLLIGFHNVDLSFNFAMFEHELNRSFIDVGFMGIERSVRELYMAGLDGIILGVIFLTLSYLLMIDLYDENKKSEIRQIWKPRRFCQKGFGS